MAFNVVKEWPLGGALEDSETPFPGVTIESGMFLKKVDHPTAAGQFAVRPLTTGDTPANTGEALFALDRSAAFDVIEAGQIPYLVKNAIIETDQVAAGSSFTVIGVDVFNSLNGGADAGKVVEAGGPSVGAILVGTFDGDSTLEDINGNSIDAIRLILD